MRKIPVRISFAFFITAAVIGFLASQSLIGTLIWIGIIFVSVLVHEYGHAISSLIFGQNPRIELVAFGGATIPQGPSLPLWKEFIVVFCGPLFGFFLFLASSILLNLHVFSSPFINGVLDAFRVVNLFWTIINLLPVLPLDGGQLMRIIMEGIMGVKGRRIALYTSMALSIALGLIVFIYGMIILGVLFFLFAFQNFEMLRQTKGISESDGNEHLKEEIVIAEHQYLSGQIDDAKRHFEEIIKQVKEGIIHRMASEYLAQIYAGEGNEDEAYNLLIQIKTNDLSDMSKCLLHKLCFDKENYAKVIELAGPCFQQMPSLEMAKRTAISAAAQKDVKTAIGWLKTCMQYGLENLEELINQSVFDTIRSSDEFKKFIEKNRS